jgi:GNAT superfamily N-acetyltransferase
MNFQIRKFRIRDYNELIKLWNESNLPYRPKGRDSKKELARQTRFSYVNMLVAEKDNKIIGSVFGSHDGRRGWINRLAVLPEYRRQRVATRLVQEIEKWLVKEKIKIICSLVENKNISSINFISIAGYKRHYDIIYFSKRENDSV